jgi:hypothetical protein
MSQSPLNLAFGFSFEDLYTREGIVKLDAEFLHQLQATDAGLRARLGESRANRPPWNGGSEAHPIAPPETRGELFDIGEELTALQSPPRWRL